MLQPKRTKFRRVQKGRNRGLSHRGSTIAFGSFGLKALEPGWITSRQIEASRIAVTRYMKREGKVWIRIFPDKPVTSKPAEVRMGKGKGSVDHWISKVSSGTMIFEIETNSKILAIKALQAAQIKLPINTKIISE
jgi:large subunit ribosomal protein L16